MTARKTTALAARLAELAIEPRELAAICRVTVETVEKWIADGPDGEGAIFLRVLDQDHVATLAVERVRSRITRSYAGDAARLGSLPTPPHGAFGGATGGQPS